MRFSNLVELEDVEEAARLHREALKQSATDPLTGRVRNSLYTYQNSIYSIIATGDKIIEHFIAGLVRN